MALNIVDRIDNLVGVRHLLASVSDKSGLDTFVPQLVALNPDLKIFSTGGTYARLQEILGQSAAAHLVRVSDYTGQPETQGGLVKTLDFKIYLGLLTETYNNAHQDDLKRTAAVPIDMVVVNLYPFQETISKADVTVERARGNIDIGGPCMIRAAAKKGLSGMELLAGIPGGVGGALRMNAGAFGSETWAYVAAVETVDRAGVLHTRSPGEFQVGYRSVTGVADEWFVAAHLLLERGDAAAHAKTMSAATRKACQPGCQHQTDIEFSHRGRSRRRARRPRL